MGTKIVNSAGDAPRVLITRLSHIGDCVLTLPLANAIKQQLPESTIIWAVETPSDQLLSMHPAVDQLIRVPKGWMGKPAKMLALRKQLKELSIDVVIDPQGITKSAALGWLSGASTRVGIRGRWGRELSPWLNNRLIRTKSQHLVDRTLELLAGLDLDPSQSEPMFDLPLCPEATENMDRWLNEAARDSGLDLRQYVVLNPGASWDSKQWELDRFAEVAGYLMDHHDLPSIITWAGKQERVMAEKIFRRAEESCWIASRTSLRELTAISAGATFFLGCDTGPLHIAAAVDTPCIGLHGPTLPEESGAYGDQHLAVQKRYHSGTCRQRRNANNDAMREITSADVFSACDQLLDELASSRLNHRNAA